MSTRRYIKPPWGQRYIGNRMSPLFRPSLISRLSVQGRRSGTWHTTPVAVLEEDGERYLISYRGASDWARNLEASPHARLTQHGHIEEIDVVDVPIADRAPLLATYRERFGKMPTWRCAGQTSRSSRSSDVPHRCNALGVYQRSIDIREQRSFTTHR
jgi:deazaflavin-dependent oxidoreductase (nitroreductase family)